MSGYTPAAVAFVNDPDANPKPPHDVLRDIYGLTPAEAQIAGLLMGGTKVGEIVERLGVSTATVRTHVRRILEKTRARGQSDLVRIPLATAAGRPGTMKER